MALAAGMGQFWDILKLKHDRSIYSRNCSFHGIFVFLKIIFLDDIYEDALVPLLLLSLMVRIKLLISWSVKLPVYAIGLTLQLYMWILHMQIISALYAKWTRSLQRGVGFTMTAWQKWSENRDICTNLGWKRSSPAQAEMDLAVSVRTHKLSKRS